MAFLNVVIFKKMDKIEFEGISSSMIDNEGNGEQNTQYCAEFNMNDDALTPCNAGNHRKNLDKNHFGNFWEIFFYFF